MDNNGTTHQAGIIKPIRGIIFDLDGTLVDTEDASIKAIVEYIQANWKKDYGYIDERYYRDIYFSQRMGWQKAMSTIFEKLLKQWDDKPENFPSEFRSEENKNLKPSEQFLETQYRRILKIFNTLSPSLNWIEGAKDFLRLHGNKYRVAICTNASTGYIVAPVEEINRLVSIPPELAICPNGNLRDDLNSLKVKYASKPDPEMTNLCLKGLGLKPEEVIFVGDGKADAGAAKAAGVRFVLLRNSLNEHEDFGELPRVGEVRNLTDLEIVIAQENRKAAALSQSIQRVM